MKLKVTSTRLKQDEKLEKEIMSSKHGMICIKCMEITETTKTVRREYNKGLVIGDVLISCGHCGIEQVVTLDFMKN
ncbi:hypothetical protein ACI1TM_01525 [Lactococcus garvieae]|uniref:hypothetical protein n=1 Tax=Lactococcus garvieae TaxID=1363 RepID=UPI0038524355